MKKNKIKSAKKILRECFLGVIDFNEKAALHAMELYANQFRTKVDSEMNKIIEYDTYNEAEGFLKKIINWQNNGTVIHRPYLSS